jgi:ribosomal protein L29
MKHQDLIKYHQMPVADLALEVQKLQVAYADTKLKLSLGQLKNVRSAKMIRQDIARLKSISRFQQLTHNLVKPITLVLKPKIIQKPLPEPTLAKDSSKAKPKAEKSTSLTAKTKTKTKAKKE